MYTRYALCKCHICSRPSHYDRPQGSTVQKFFISTLQPTSPVASTQSSSSPSRPTTHHSPTSSLKIPSYPHQNKKVSVLSLVCPSPLSDLTISSPSHYDCISYIIVFFFYCISFSPLFSLMATIFLKKVQFSLVVQKMGSSPRTGNTLHQ